MWQYLIKIAIVFVLTLNCPSLCYSFPLNVQDARGKELSLFSTPQRIISLSPAITETLFALGLDRKIVGVTNLCDYPPRAKKKTKIGSYIRPNIEKVIALQPDLVLCTTHTSPTVKKLEELRIPVFAINPKTLKESIDSILTIGKIIGKAKEAVEIVAKLNQRVKAVTDRLKNLKEEDKPSVLWQIGSNPLVTVGPGTFGHDLVVLAGGRNIVDDAPIKYPRYSLEAILRKDPEVIIIVGMTEGDYSTVEMEKWGKWKNLSAVKNGRIHRIDLSLVTRRGSPRMVDGLEEIVHILHPELFKGESKRECPRIDCLWRE